MQMWPTKIISLVVRRTAATQTHELYTHLFVILHMLIDVMGEQCSTEMLTYMYHNKVFCGHIIAWTTTCIQRCCFVQKQSAAQNVSNDNVLQS